MNKDKEDFFEMLDMMAFLMRNRPDTVKGVMEDLWQWVEAKKREWGKQYGYIEMPEFNYHQYKLIEHGLSLIGVEELDEGYREVLKYLKLIIKNRLRGYPSKNTGKIGQT